MDVVFWNGGIKWEMLSRYIGPYKIAHWIRKRGYDCQVIDFIDQLSEEQLYAATKKFVTKDTKILAISMTFISNNVYKWESGNPGRIPEYCVRVLRNIKKEFPDLKVVIGGYMSDRVSGWGVVDASIMSYTDATEEIFIEYLKYLYGHNEAPIGRLIFPVWGSKPVARMHYETARDKSYNIETDDFKFIKQDCILPGEPLPLDVSRGCIFACRFCQYPHLGKKKLDYIRGMEYIEAELRNNYDMWGTTNYYMLDDTFNDTEFKMQEFYNMTQRLPFKITFSAYLRADLIHRFPNMAHLLEESGLFGAYHGIETFHPEASKLVGKGWSGTHAKEYIPELFHNVWKGKIPMHTNFIVGFTGDTRKNVHETATWFINNNLHSIQFNQLGLFGPGNERSRYTVQSEFDKNAEKYGFIFTEGENEGYRAWKNDNWTSKTAYHVSQRAGERIKPYKKINTWAVQPLLWYGYSKEYMMTARHVEMPWLEFRAKSAQKYQEYYAQLMSM